MHKVINEATDKLKIYLDKRLVTKDDLRQIVNEFGLRITDLHLAEALWVSCDSSKDLSKFEFDQFAKWLMRNIPLLHDVKGSRF